MPLATAVTLFADGLSEAEILADLPYLEREDIVESLRFADVAVRERGASPSRALGAAGRGYSEGTSGVLTIDRATGRSAGYGPSSPTGMTAMPSGRQ